MEGLELIAFEIISSVGTARSCYIEAINEAKSEKVFIEGHDKHNELLQKEASGEGNVVNLLILHAEDQLMSAEGFKIIAQEFIDVYRRINVK